MKKVALPLLLATGITVADSRTGFSGKDALSVSQPIAQHVERMPQYYEFWKWQKKKEKEEALKFLMPEVRTLTGSSKTLTADQQKQFEKESSNLVFIENKGQWPREILFLCQNNGTDIWITKKGVVYDLYTVNEIDGKTFRSGQIITFNNLNTLPENQISVSSKQKQTAHYNYFIGNNPDRWASNVGLYKEAVIKNIYPGIDMRYYFQNNNLRYDYIVNPNADISQIKIALEGAFGYSLNQKGELVLKTRFGEVKQTELFTYQLINGNKKAVASAFQLNGNVLQFKIGNYDKSKPLIIDPLIWSTYIGGYENDRVYSVVERNGNAYISGWSTGVSFLTPHFPTTPGAYDTNVNGTKAFVSKFSNDGSSLVYSTFIGPVSTSGGGNVHADGVFIDVDFMGNAYITANGKPGYPTTPGVFNSSNSGYGVYVSKLNSTGTALLYSTFVGGGKPRAITVDNLGYAYITGSSGSGFPTTPGAYDQTFNGGDDVFVTKLDTNASSLKFSTYLGGSGAFEEGFAIKVDNNYNVIVAGIATSANFPTTTGSYDNTYNGGSGTFPCDGFVAKLNSTGSNLIFSTFLGGSYDDEIYGLDIDNDNDIYVTGYTLSTNFPYTPGVIDTVKNGTGTSSSDADAFVVKLSSNGSSLIYSTFFGASGNQKGLAITVDQNKNAWICGRTDDSPNSIPLTVDALQSSPRRAFLACINANATILLYSTYLGGSTAGAANVAKSLTNDYAGGVYVAGWTGTSNFPVTPGAFQPTKANPSVYQYSDGFVLKFQYGTPSYIQNGNNLINNFILFPNPSSGIFTIQTEKGGVFELIDITGRVLNTYTLTTNTARVIQVNLPVGIYFIREKASGAMQKLIIE